MLPSAAPAGPRDRDRVGNRRNIDDAVDVRVGADAARQATRERDVGGDGAVLGRGRDARNAAHEDAVARVDGRTHADVHGVHVALGDLEHRFERRRVGDVRDHGVLRDARPGSTSTLCTTPPVCGPHGQGRDLRAICSELRLRLHDAGLRRGDLRLRVGRRGAELRLLNAHVVAVLPRRDDRLAVLHVGDEAAAVQRSPASAPAARSAPSAPARCRARSAASAVRCAPAAARFRRSAWATASCACASLAAASSAGFSICAMSCPAETDAPRLDEELVDHAALRCRDDAHAIGHERSLRADRAHERAFAHDVGDERRAVDGAPGVRADPARRPGKRDEQRERGGNRSRAISAAGAGVRE